MVYYLCFERGVSMTLAEAVRRALKKGKTTQTELGRIWGTTPQVVNNKIRLDRWTGAELAQIASFGGGNLAIVYPDGEQLLIDSPADGETKPDAEA